MTRLSNLPPGVTASMLEPVDFPSFHCSHCGAFISQKPTRRVTKTTEEWCDGKIHEVDENFDESTIRIIGDEFRDKTYKVQWNQCKSQWNTDISEHEPHFYDAFEETSWESWCRKCGTYTVTEAEISSCI